MKRFMVVVLAFFAILSMASAQSKEILLAISEWEPYTGEKIQANGMLTELTSEALKRMGLSPVIAVFPWARCVENVRTGSSHVLIGASYTQERAAWFEYPEPLWISSIVIYKQKSNTRTSKFTTLAGLGQATVSILNGSFLEKDLVTIPTIKINKSNAVNTSLQMLTAGRVDYFIESQDSVQYLLATQYKEYANKVDFLMPPYLQDKIYAVFSKTLPDAAALATKFNAAIAGMKKDGTYKKISARYNL